MLYCGAHSPFQDHGSHNPAVAGDRYHLQCQLAAKYTFGVGADGTSTYAGGGLHEITSQISNDMLRIDNPPPYFNLTLNVVQPGNAGG